MNVEIRVKDGENIDHAIKRFRRAVRDADIMNDYEKSRFFIPKAMRRSHSKTHR